VFTLVSRGDDQVAHKPWRLLRLVLSARSANGFSGGTTRGVPAPSSPRQLLCNDVAASGAAGSDAAHRVAARGDAARGDAGHFRAGSACDRRQTL